MRNLKPYAELGDSYMRIPLTLRVFLCVCAGALQAAAAITYIQNNYVTPQSPQTTVQVSFIKAQTAGNLNVVVVGWNDSSTTVSTVTDTKGNVYKLAVGPTVQSGYATQSIYYSANIVAAAANANSVTVTFSKGARYADIRVLEYSGVDPVNPVDVTAAASGTSTMSNSGVATTTNANDLIFGANLVQSGTTGPGSGFTSRLITPQDGDIAEDRIVTVTGSYSATATISPSAQWVMSMVALRAAGAAGGDTQPPSTPGILTASVVGPQITLNWGASIDNVGVTQYLIERCTGAGCLNFVQIGTSTGTSYGDTGLAGSTSYSYRVRATDAAGNLSGYTNTATATTGDTQAPGAPGTLSAAASGNQINLNWGPASDNVGVTKYLVERCQGVSCINFVQIGTAPNTTYSDTGLAGSTSYSYCVRATDAAGNLGPYSNIAVAATSDTLAPTAPSNLAGVATETQATLTWTASSDNVGVTQYFVERCTGAGCFNFLQIGATATATFSDSNLTASTTYLYRVRATDAAGNLSGYSNIATLTTQAHDWQAPSTPTNVTASPSTGQISLTWTASNDNVAVTGYLVERCSGAGCSTFAQIGTPSGASYTDSGLAPSTSYSYRVRATDAAGNLSNYSNLATATTPAPAAITFVQRNYVTPQSSQTSVSIAYASAQTAGNLNVVVVGWNDSTRRVTGVSDSRGNTYMLAVGPTVQSGYATQSIYYANNIVAGSNTVTVTFGSAARYPDIRILEYGGLDPVNPLDVTAAGSGNGTSANSGSATTTSTNDLIVGADLVQTGTAGPGSGFTSRVITPQDGDIAEDRIVSSIGSYSATATISPADQWIMQMVAFRAASGGPVPPTPPSNLTASASTPSQLALSWTASVSNVGVANYLVERCQGDGCSIFTQIGTSTTTSYADMGLANSTSYTYRVRAVDTTGLISMYSNTATATTQASSVTISPRVTALTSARTQQFTSNAPTVTWSVDGVTGGSATAGTITSAGLYTPPSAAGIHVVTVFLTSDSSQTASATVYVTNYPGTFTRDVDTARTGLNSHEIVLAPSNVNSAQFGKLFSYTLDGVADASPLYVTNVNMPGKGSHNVVYVATEHDSVYAFDADGLSTTPLWQASLANPSANITSIPAADTDPRTTFCCDLSPEVGITSSPVIDPATATLYVATATKEVTGGTTNYYEKLHALDIATGAEKFGGPVIIQAAVPGTGDGSSGSQVHFMVVRQGQRPALLLSGGVVYLGFGGHDDYPPYHGWVMGYNASTLQQVMVYNTTPNGAGGGIWQSGDGLAADAAGNILFVTGNGDFDADTGGKEYSDSVVGISPSGAVLDYFTPHDQAAMASSDLDLGSGGLLLLPDQAGPHPHVALSAGKNGTIYVVDRDNMGHYNATNDNQIVQTLVNTFPGGTNGTGNFKAPVYFNGTVYFSADSDTIKAFHVNNSLLSTAPTSQTTLAPGYPGATLSMSSDGSTNGILWAIERIDLDQSGQGTPASGVLHAFDATNLSIELYNSRQAAGNRDSLDHTAKWSAPLIANGKVFVASNGRLTAFGLLP